MDHLVACSIYFSPLLLLPLPWQSKGALNGTHISVCLTEAELGLLLPPKKALIYELANMSMESLVLAPPEKLYFQLPNGCAIKLLHTFVFICFTVCLLAGNCLLPTGLMSWLRVAWKGCLDSRAIETIVYSLTAHPKGKLLASASVATKQNFASIILWRLELDDVILHQQGDLGHLYRIVYLSIEFPTSEIGKVFVVFFQRFTAMHSFPNESDF
ncbi:unnamed protein product [Protopolystoma xenopodis]|uniref:Uncharacterized protein n=1 Tax=Protopolystoma xenopodis TaxID=117903 RepID=A0A448WEZ5_9PLAT|nr:unnamed protein product [Protopolystoma xenopodis]